MLEVPPLRFLSGDLDLLRPVTIVIQPPKSLKNSSPRLPYSSLPGRSCRLLSSAQAGPALQTAGKGTTQFDVEELKMRSGMPDPPPPEFPEPLPDQTRPNARSSVVPATLGRFHSQHCRKL